MRTTIEDTLTLREIAPPKPATGPAGGQEHVIYSGGVHAGAGSPRFVDDGEQFGVIGIVAAEPRDQTDAEIEAANGPEVDLPPEPATLTLGAICEWLGFTVSAGFLASIGVEHAERRKMAYLYRESQRAEIKGALMGHLGGL